MAALKSFFFLDNQWATSLSLLSASTPENPVHWPFKFQNSHTRMPRLVGVKQHYTNSATLQTTGDKIGQAAKTSGLATAQCYNVTPAK